MGTFMRTGNSRMCAHPILRLFAVVHPSLGAAIFTFGDIDPALEYVLISSSSN